MVQATFVPIPTYTLEVTKTGEGTVNASPPSGPYLSGTVVTLTAAPDEGWAFTGWSGDATGSDATINVTMSADRAVTATFKRLFAVTAASGSGGSVALSPPQTQYVVDSLVTLTATASSGWQFMGWLGDLAGGNAVETLTVSRSHSVKAIFGTGLSTSVVGQGSVVMNPAGPPLPAGSRVRLWAVPAAGHYFVFWGSPVNSSQSAINFPITAANASVAAVFLPLDVNESALNVLSDGAGSVAANPPGNRFMNGAIVQLTATPQAGQQFLGWTGGATGSANPLAVTVTASTTIVARFTSIPRFSIVQDVGLLRGSGARLWMEGRIGDHYQIEMTDTFTGNWDILGTKQNALGEVQFLDSAVQSRPRRFYRARVLP